MKLLLAKSLQVLCIHLCPSRKRSRRSLLVCLHCSSLQATVIAVNSYDESEESLPGGTAKILRVPDVPINFANVPQITTATQIGLTW